MISFKQSEINEMEINELLENIELVVNETKEELTVLKDEVKPKLVEILTNNVEIEEEEEEENGESVEVSLKRVDATS